MTAPGTPYPQQRRSMVLRHLASAGFALVATPVGIAVFDYGAGQYLRDRVVRLDDSTGPGHLLLMVLGALILLAVAASGRVSGVGPVLAAFVWGAVPLLWFMVDFASFFDVSRDLSSTHFWFANPPFLFGLVAAMLAGAGIAGRWRGSPVADSGWQHRT